MGKEYTVKNGDSLGRIAQRENISPWSLLVDWNKDRYPGLVRNPDLIQPGMRLRLYDPSQNNLTTLAERVKALEGQLELVQIRLRQVQEGWTK